MLHESGVSLIRRHRLRKRHHAELKLLLLEQNSIFIKLTIKINRFFINNRISQVWMCQPSSCFYLHEDWRGRLSEAFLQITFLAPAQILFIWLLPWEHVFFLSFKAILQGHLDYIRSPLNHNGFYLWGEHLFTAYYVDSRKCVLLSKPNYIKSTGVAWMKVSIPRSPPQTFIKIIPSFKYNPIK